MERESEYHSSAELFSSDIHNNSSSDDTTSAATAFNAMFSGVSLLSLLTTTTTGVSLHQPPPTLMASNHFTDHLLKTPKPEALPPLHSLDHLPPRGKRTRADPWAEDPRHRTFHSPAPAPAPLPRGSALQRQRRQRLGEKTRCLQRVLPWDTKMDMATMLEETYKYVKFLEAQVAALSSMPEQTGIGAGDEDGVAFGGLGRLSRNQLLQVLVNSPVAQTTLYSKGFCVFSVEQLGIVEKVAQLRRLRANNFLLPNHLSSF